MNKIKVKANSNVAKILRGETRGYYDWYVRDIMQNSNSYLIEKEPKKSKFKQAGETAGFDMRGIK